MDNDAEKAIGAASTASLGSLRPRRTQAAKPINFRSERWCRLEPPGAVVICTVPPTWRFVDNNGDGGQFFAKHWWWITRATIVKSQEPIDYVASTCTDDRNIISIRRVDFSAAAIDDFINMMRGRSNDPLEWEYLLLRLQPAGPIPMDRPTRDSIYRLITCARHLPMVVVIYMDQRWNDFFARHPPRPNPTPIAPAWIMAHVDYVVHDVLPFVGDSRLVRRHGDVPTLQQWCRRVVRARVAIGTLWSHAAMDRQASAAKPIGAVAGGQSTLGAGSASPLGSFGAARTPATQSMRPQQSGGCISPLIDALPLPKTIIAYVQSNADPSDVVGAESASPLRPDGRSTASGP
jgi:hypothetical protein